MSRIRLGRPVWLLLILVGAFATSARAEPTAEVPRVVLHGIPFSLSVTDQELAAGESRRVTVIAGASSRTILVEEGAPTILEDVVLDGGETLSLEWSGGRSDLSARTLPGWLSVAPPLFAILLAVLFRQAVIALFVGVWLGAILVFGADPFTGFLRTLDHFVVGALSDSDHVTLLLFTFAMGGMLGVMTRTGGTQGIVDAVARGARSARSGQIATWLMGLAVFFDDYANTLLVGNTMRPITDRLRISREKLSYIVDSTAAPVASIAIVSTWIGVEVGLIGTAFSSVGLEKDAFAAFVESLPYRFYPILALWFGFLVAVTGRDFGPMLRAERRARATGDVLRPGSIPLADYESASLTPPPGTPLRWWNAVIPVAVMVGAVLVFLYATGSTAAREAGEPPTLKNILGNANSYAALLWAAFLGSITAVLLALGQRIVGLGTAVQAWMDGAKSILVAASILTLAWSISAVCGEMGTAPYLVELLGEGLAPHWLPVLVFIVSGLASFATGSSWGTMGILMPLVVPLAHELAPDSGVIMSGAISSVLAGSVWGDHCSPLSDTTVMSSMASSVDHMDHVNTQLPYAILVGIVGMAAGDIPTAFGFPYWASWLIGAAALGGVLVLFGRKAEAGAEG